MQRKKLKHILSSVLLLMWLGVGVPTASFAQLGKKDKPDLFVKPTFKWGFSVGGGGANFPVGPTADVHYSAFTLRVFPGLLYASSSLQWQPGLSLRPWSYHPFPLYIGFSFHYNWLLGRPLILRQRDVTSQMIYMLMVGVRYNLNHLKTSYLEMGVGPALFADGIRPENDSPYTRNTFLPMVEIRFGTILGELRFKKKR